MSTVHRYQKYNIFQLLYLLVATSWEKGWTLVPNAEQSR